MPSWEDLLQQNLKPSDDGTVRLRTCLMGIGSDLRGDDSVGLIVARALLQDKQIAQVSGLLILEGGPAPENYTGKIRAFQAEFVLLIDAAQLNEAPGAIRWIPIEAIDGMSASTHSLPLSMLASYLRHELNCEVGVLGIQPGQNEIGAELSLPVRAAANEIQMEIRELFL